MDAYTQILTETRDGVLLITYNRPDRLNAWTRQMSRELVSAIEAANADPLIGAIVVTGAFWRDATREMDRERRGRDR